MSRKVGVFLCTVANNDNSFLKCCTDEFKTKSSVHVEPPTLQLTQDQKRLLVQMWKKEDFSWLFELGTAIYSRIFEDAPETKILFPYVAEAEKLKQDVRTWKQFRAQSLRFVQVLEQTVSHIEDPNSINIHEVLFDLGDRHKKFTKRGFKPKFWDVFEEAVGHVMRKEAELYLSWTEDEKEMVTQAWKTLANFVIDGMKIGFYSEKS